MPAPQTAPQVEVVVPVHNEQAALEASIRRLHRFLSESFPFSWRDRDRRQRELRRDADARRPAGRRAGGRGRRAPAGQGPRARAARLLVGEPTPRSSCYMDVDLSTDLRGLLPLVAPLLSGHSDVAIGTRLANGAHVVRGAKRELISRAYNRLLHALLRTRFSDAQCGFKAGRTEVLRELLPDVRDEAWFFDTELLVARAAARAAHPRASRRLGRRPGLARGDRPHRARRPARRRPADRRQPHHALRRRGRRLDARLRGALPRCSWAPWRRPAPTPRRWR